MQNLIYLNPYQIKISGNPRSVLNKESIAELAASIKAHGQQQAVLVRPSGKDYELVFGRRRLEAAKLLSTKDKPFLLKSEVQDVQDDDVEELRTIENLQREDLPPIDEAAAFKRLLDKEGYTVDMLADKIGKSKKYIVQHVSLNNLSKEIQKALGENAINISHALVLARYPAERQQLYFKAIFYGVNLREGKTFYKHNSPLSAKQLSRLIQEEQEFDLSHVKFDVTDENLLKGVPSCVKCPKNTSNDIGLFEGHKKNICTDAKCRELKMLAHLANLKAINNDAPYIEGSSYPSRKTRGITPVLQFDSYENSEKSQCPDTEIAIIVHHDNENKIGSTAYICRNKKCKVHNKPEQKYSTSPAQRKQQSERNAYNKKRKQEMAAMNVYRPQLLQLTLHNLPKDSIDFFKILALRRFHNMDKKDKSISMNPEVAKALGLVKETKEKYCLDIPLTKVTGCKDRHFLQKLIFASAIDSYVNIDNWQKYESLKSDKQRNGDYLLEAAELILGKSKVGNLIKEAEAKFIKPVMKSKSKKSIKSKKSK